MEAWDYWVGISTRWRTCKSRIPKVSDSTGLGQSLGIYISEQVPAKGVSFLSLRGLYSNPGLQHGQAGNSCSKTPILNPDSKVCIGDTWWKVPPRERGDPWDTEPGGFSTHRVSEALKHWVGNTFQTGHAPIPRPKNEWALGKICKQKHLSWKKRIKMLPGKAGGKTDIRELTLSSPM